MTKLYKVLDSENHSTHGGSLTWSVPTRKDDGTFTPGEWHEVAGEVRACERGLHLTNNPMHWPKIGMRVYEAEGDGASDTDGGNYRHKIAFQRARLIRPADDAVPEHWRKVEAFVVELPTLPWMQPDGNPDPAWQLFPTRDAARDAAWGAAGEAARGAAGEAARGAALDAARGAAWDAAWGAAGGAALWARVLVCEGLPISQQHVDHAEARMNVWRKGYGLYCDVNGVLYVYESLG